MTRPKGYSVQVHVLTEFAGVLLNRDEDGFAKRMELGGAQRTRISSQCLKRHWRTHDGEMSLRSLGLPESVRSRATFEIEVAGRAADEHGLPPALTAAVAGVIKEAVGLGTPDASKPLRTKQVLTLGAPEIAYLRGLTADISGQVAASLGADRVAALSSPDDAEAAAARGAAEEAARALVPRKGELAQNLSAVGAHAGLAAAMFGRMVTSDPLARVDAPVHVAHAFTVHPEQSEVDYFTALDDAVGDAGEAESGHINTTEINSGLFYIYFRVDVPALWSNLTGRGASQFGPDGAEVTGALVERLIHTAATVTPGAKLGSTAPHSVARAVLVEAGSRAPRSLAGAFTDALAASDAASGGALRRLGEELAGLEGMYGAQPARALSARTRDPGASELAALLGVELAPLAASAAWARAQIEAEAAKRGGER